MQKKKLVEGEANVRYTYVYKTFSLNFRLPKKRKKYFLTKQNDN